MENKIERMKRRINRMIDNAKEHFEMYGWNQSYDLKIARIDGCLTMLEMLTEKEYYYDDNGLHEV